MWRLAAHFQRGSSENFGCFALITLIRRRGLGGVPPPFFFLLRSTAATVPVREEQRRVQRLLQEHRPTHLSLDSRGPPPHSAPALRGNPPAAHSRGRLHGHPFVLVASTQNLQGVEEQLSRRQSLRAAQKAERRCCACVTPGPDRLQGGDQQNPREALGQPRRRRQNPSESFRERCAAAAGALRL